MKCTIGQGKPKQAMDDSQLFNWLAGTGRPRLKWACWFGFGEQRTPHLQQVTSKMAKAIGEERCRKTPQEAIEAAIAIEFERSQKHAAELLKERAVE